MCSVQAMDDGRQIGGKGKGAIARLPLLQVKEVLQSAEAAGSKRGRGAVLFR